MRPLARRDPQGGLLPARLGGLLSDAGDYLQEQWTPRALPSLDEIYAMAAARGPVTEQDVAGYAVDMASPFAKLGGLLGHTVWHGSPHKWDVPDISKVGTGEGAQAYGHGFYSAESPEIAKGYQERLSTFDPYGARRPKIATIDGVPASEINQDAWEIADVLASQSIDINQYIADLKRKAKLSNNKNRKQVFSELIKQAEQQKPFFDGKTVKFEGGYLYKLDIPDEDIPRYLDWDKPLSEQSEEVQKAVIGPIVQWKAGITPDHENYDAMRNLIMQQMDALIGQQAYAAMADQFSIGGVRGSLNPQNAAKASQALIDAGIPGIRYLDASSRGAGEGTYNYVTFDPSRIKVLERQ